LAARVLADGVHLAASLTAACDEEQRVRRAARDLQDAQAVHPAERARHARVALAAAPPDAAADHVDVARCVDRQCVLGAGRDDAGARRQRERCRICCVGSSEWRQCRREWRARAPAQ